MARTLYAASAGDYTASETGQIIPNVDLTIWDAYEGGSQVIDVVPGPGVTFGGGLLRSSEYGLVPFYGPEGFTGDLFLESTPDFPRVRVTPSPTAAASAEIETRGLVTAASADVTYARQDQVPAAYQEVIDAAEADAAAASEPLTVSGKRAVRRDELVVNVDDYGAAGNGVADDTAAIQAAVNAASTLGAVVHFSRRKTYRVSTIKLPYRAMVVGNRATLTTTSDATVLVVDGSEVSVDGLVITGDGTGAGGETKANQHGIRAWASSGFVRQQVWITRCQFYRLQATAVNVKNFTDVSITNNTIRECGYAGIIGYGCSDLAVMGNTIDGTRSLPTFAPNSYGISFSAYEPDGVPGGAAAPRSSEIVISGNIIRRQRWAAIDTHVGQRVVISNNVIYDSPAVGINCVYISTVPASGGDLSPQDLSITGNVLHHPTFNETNADMHIGIAVSGADTATAGRERVRGTISGNTIYRYGRKDNFLSGGILIRTGRGVTVVGNALIECRSYGVNVIDSQATVIVGNTVVDVWKSLGETSAAFYLQMDNDTVTDAVVAGNIIARGSVSSASWAVNGSAVTGNLAARVTLGANDFGDTPINGNFVFRSQVGAANVEITGTAAPTTGTWRQGDRVVNTSPSASGFIGWVCTAPGTPGTWKTYGAISA